MIKIPRKQLFNPLFLSAVVYAILLGALFLFDSRLNWQFSFYIAVTQAVIIAYLFFVQQRLAQKQAEAVLEEQDYAEKTNLTQSEIANERFALEAWHAKIQNYFQLKDLTEKLSLCLSLADTSRVITQESLKFFGKGETSALLYLFYYEKGELGLIAAHREEGALEVKSKQGDIFDKWVVKTLQPLLIEDVKNDFRFDVEKISTPELRKIQSLISVPLIAGHRPIGVLRVDFPQEKYFKTDDLRLLNTIGDLGAVAVENALLYEKTEELAIRDSLTGLFLKRHFLVRLSEEISRQLRQKKSLSFLMIDLDKFKQYNDTYGHMAGDIVLKTVSFILQESFQDPGDLICRFGGEEFAVLLPDRSKKEAIELAENVRKKIKKQEIILRKEKTGITVSVGVATFPDDTKMKEELIHTADRAMYKAKSEGRNKVCFF